MQHGRRAHDAPVVWRLALQRRSFDLLDRRLEQRHVTRHGLRRPDRAAEIGDSHAGGNAVSIAYGQRNRRRLRAGIAEALGITLAACPRDQALEGAAGMCDVALPLAEPEAAGQHATRAVVRKSEIGMTQGALQHRVAAADRRRLDGDRALPVGRFLHQHFVTGRNGKLARPKDRAHQFGQHRHRDLRERDRGKRRAAERMHAPRQPIGVVRWAEPHIALLTQGLQEPFDRGAMNARHLAQVDRGRPCHRCERIQHSEPSAQGSDGAISHHASSPSTARLEQHDPTTQTR